MQLNTKTLLFKNQSPVYQKTVVALVTYGSALHSVWCFPLSNLWPNTDSHWLHPPRDPSPGMEHAPQHLCVLPAVIFCRSGRKNSIDPHTLAIRHLNDCFTAIYFRLMCLKCHIKNYAQLVFRICYWVTKVKTKTSNPYHSLFHQPSKLLRVHTQFALTMHRYKLGCKVSENLALWF